MGKRILYLCLLCLSWLFASGVVSAGTTAITFDYDGGGHGNVTYGHVPIRAFDYDSPSTPPGNERENQNTGTSRFFVTFRDFFAAKEITALRQQYINEVLELKDVGNTMRTAGTSAEDTARMLHQMRRDLGVQYKNLTPPDVLDRIYKANIRDYGDPLGPSIEWLQGRGKTWVRGFTFLDH